MARKETKSVNLTEVRKALDATEDLFRDAQVHRVGPQLVEHALGLLRANHDAIELALGLTETDEGDDGCRA